MKIIFPCDVIYMQKPIFTLNNNVYKKKSSNDFFSLSHSSKNKIKCTITFISFFALVDKKSLMKAGSSCGSTCLIKARIKLNVQLLCEVFLALRRKILIGSWQQLWQYQAVQTHATRKILPAKLCQRQCGLSCTGLETMDQISIKKPNPKCRLFLKIDQ